MPGITRFCPGYYLARQYPALSVKAILRLEVAVGRGDEQVDALDGTAVNEVDAALSNGFEQVADEAGGDHCPPCENMELAPIPRRCSTSGVIPSMLG